ncbi:MAG: glycosyltransferase family 2 protein [Planctomycetales bacterium]|nr:glycosyltransferase family 2 protein [Planctomycetales bacterium]
MLDYTDLAVALLQERDARQKEDARKQTKPLLSVVIPVYNEEATIREIVQQVMAVEIDKEVLIVDDCSTDGTHEVLSELSNDPNVHVFYHEYNHGKGAALRTGFLEARGEYVVVQDADLEYDPQDYPKLLEPLQAGEADVVYGSRFLGDEVRDPSFVHRLGNGILTWSSNIFTGQKLTDMETCYKVFRREALQEIQIEQDRFGFEPEITAKLARRKMRIREVPIAYRGRGYEEGKKIGWRDGLNAFYCIVRYGLAD